MPSITNQKFLYSPEASILHRNITVFVGERKMSAATITQAQDKGLRHQFSALAASVRDFATELFAAHGGWLAPATKAAFLRTKLESRARLVALASQAEAHSPSLSNELRQFASRG
jgi:hypothetical protein